MPGGIYLKIYTQGGYTGAQMTRNKGPMPQNGGKEDEPDRQPEPSDRTEAETERALSRREAFKRIAAGLIGAGGAAIAGWMVTKGSSAIAQYYDYSDYYSNYSDYYNYSDYSDYSNYYNYSDYSDYSNYYNYSDYYGDYSDYSNYSNYTDYSNYSDDYSIYAEYTNYYNYGDYSDYSAYVDY
jgi:hypothetical protein